MLMIITAIMFSLTAYLWLAVSEAETLRQEVENRLAPPPPLRERVRLSIVGAVQHHRWISDKTLYQLEITGQSVTTYEMRSIMIGILAAVVLGLDMSMYLAPLGLFLGFAMNKLLLTRKFNGWRTEIVVNTGNLVLFLKALLQAGNTVEQAIQAVTHQLTGPLQVEWARMVAARDSGVSLRQALSGLSERINDRDFSAVLSQLIVYERESVPDEPFGNLSGHLMRIQMLNREYLTKRSTSTITLYAGIAMFSAMIAGVGPALYIMLVQSLGGTPL